MVIWVSYYDTELKKRVRGVPQDIFDDPKVSEEDCPVYDNKVHDGH